MDEAAFEEILTDALESYDDDAIEMDVATFEERDLMTRNRGVVVRTGDAEFQITIVRAR